MVHFYAIPPPFSCPPDSSSFYRTFSKFIDFTNKSVEVAADEQELEEERFLAKSLPGYAEYCQKVRYRLLPLVW